MSSALVFEPAPGLAATQELRAEVRAFLAEEAPGGVFGPQHGAGTSRFDPAFSRRMGERGWIGMTWPKQYGGHERSHLERYAVLEECFVANAPLWFHFIADRQSGPVLLKYAAEPIKETLLPRITRGELCFCIGMSEPDSGSDLFAAKAAAARTNDGWRLSGRKLWTSHAHRADYMIGVFRTSPSTAENRRFGLSQFLIDMASPGITTRPVLHPNGGHEFNEVIFDDVDLPADHLLGEVDRASHQLTSELAFERSGPERFLETYGVLRGLVALAAENPDARAAEAVGRLTAQLHVLRQMSLSVAARLAAGEEPVLEAAVVKEVGTVWEQALPGVARDVAALIEASEAARESFDTALRATTLIAPKLTIQGGTIEILRGIVARGIGLR